MSPSPHGHHKNIAPPRGAPTKTVAILPWGDVIEDYLNDLGLTLEAFCQEMTGGWLFGYAEALGLAGWRPIICCISRNVEEPRRLEHAPTGTDIWLLPVPRAYRALQWGAGALAARTRGRSGLLYKLMRRCASTARRDAAPYLATPLGELARVLRRENCSAILCQEYEYPRFDVSVALGCRLRIPVFASFQGGTWQRSRLEHFLRPHAVRACAGLIIAPGEEAWRVASSYRVDAAKIARIFNPINLSAWHVPPRGDARRILGLPPHALTLVWHGRISVRQKGVDILLDAWQQVSAHWQYAAAVHPHQEIRLVMVGTGPDAAEVERMLRNLGLENVTWLNEFVLERNTIQQYLAAGDLYVFPSRYEGFAMAPVEAMASGLPVVAASSAGIDELFARGAEHGGIVVPREDAAALAHAITRLLQDRELRKHLGRRARMRIEEHLALPAVGRKLGAFFDTRLQASTQGSLRTSSLSGAP